MEAKGVKAFKQGDSIVVVIPSTFADVLEIGAGDYLSVNVKDKKLVYSKIPFKE